MNLAFPALCMLLIALPGIIYRKAYSRGAVPIFFPLSRQKEEAVNKYPTSIRPLSEEIGLGLITAIVLNIIWLNVCTFATSHTFNFQPDYEKLVFVLFGDLKPSSTHPPAPPDRNSYEDVLLYLAKHHTTLAGYFLSLYAFSFISARIALRVVRQFHLDHEWMALRLDDQWFYFLRGEIFRFKEFRRFIRIPHNISGTYVSVVVAQHDGDYLYKGFLWDFFLNDDGGLDRLLLHNVIRCRFAPGKTAPVKETTIQEHSWAFERVSSQLFTVKYADCKTLACTYFYIIEKKSPAPVPPIT